MMAAILNLLMRSDQEDGYLKNIGHRRNICIFIILSDVGLFITTL